MGPLRVLVVDDEEKIRQVIGIYLTNEGYRVEEAVDGEEALRKFRAESWDLIILDVMMPKMDGIAVCQEIRRVSKVPIIMLTAKNEEVDRILGLEFGADDYMGKPFSPRELVARIKAVMRRAGTESKKEEHILKFPGMRIDLISREIQVKEKPVTLTPKEFELLALLAKTAGRSYSREQLLEEVWGFDYYGDVRTVDTHVNRLRDKLRAAGAPNFIKTVWGVGYKFEVEA
ncbi:two component transcriptional regulator, winged helix family [Desulfotomaculum nigrificans CO-1-SRB]|uniref:Stage 0 sporulation protein A homolog n=1 Tax=Desulfotomaculum nigrificans (strain DSM 14880 / VKM B-2319 / CO-1-SRB) TaxID=868595 RepID=F6B3T3_DESCC|nr:response regulator transcription factor [Desulfotomaculum nigrificans]AEF95242.1 two component transcriptional regulator, winged helix family [Desulfotomaculum nigrificans CO-1-SRB]